MSLLLQISDTHFGTEQPAVVQALSQLARDARPDLLVLSGDITQRARARQFEAARAFTDGLGLPLLAIPGNHDIPLFNLAARLLWPYAGYSRAFGPELEPQHSSPELLVIGVNTTRRWRHKHGELSARQIERVAARLQGAEAAQLRVVVVHQPVAVPQTHDANNLLRGCTAALQRWSEAGADVVMGGHIHLPYVLPLRGLARPVWAVQAGTAVSSRTRRGGPNSVNLLRWGDGAPPGVCVVERWDYARDDHRFHLFGSSPLKPVRP
ncbi:MAG: metallophosphoesterase family protein [Parvibaculum sp.]|uniref:metallophosphoesterase family protein n=1 Tax=Parvibaculum sp. TaxID=2024848 RepID=UPI002732223B|nr:metallophosphoesterase [Parvibaculum sp.]MDP2149254.1 metallophosphoesterase family protein [Parvibaculum sp.]